LLKADFRIAMTGTPIENNLTELRSLVPLPQVARLVLADFCRIA